MCPSRTGRPLREWKKKMEYMSERGMGRAKGFEKARSVGIGKSEGSFAIATLFEAIPIGSKTSEPQTDTQIVMKTKKTLL